MHRPAIPQRGQSQSNLLSKTKEELIVVETHNEGLEVAPRVLWDSPDRIGLSNLRLKWRLFSPQGIYIETTGYYLAHQSNHRVLCCKKALDMPKDFKGNTSSIIHIWSKDQNRTLV